MATTVREPLLNCQRDKRCRRKKLIAALLLAVFLLVVFGSIFAFGKSSRKFHKSLHKLEDRVEDLQKSYKSSLSALQKDLESTKSHLQIPQNQSRNHEMRSGETDKGLLNLQQKLKEAQEEMEIQREAMREFLKVFGSYKEETNQELSKLRDAQMKDQEEIERLKTALADIEMQRDADSQAMNSRKDDSFSQEKNVTVQLKNNEAGTAEVKPKANPNLIVRSARAVKDYVSSLAAKLNPFRSSKDKNSKPKTPVVQEGTMKKPLEEVSAFVKPKNVENLLDDILSILGTSNVDDADMAKALRSKFYSLDLVLKELIKNNIGGQDRVLKWKKDYIPVKEQFEKIEQESIAHNGSKGHHHHQKHSSKQFQKLANMTRHLKDSFQSLLKQ